MKQRTIIENDDQFQFLFGNRDSMSRNTQPSINSNVAEEDNGKAEFILNHDFGEKFDLAKDSARFTYDILNRMLSLNGVEDYQYIGIEGDFSSIGYFLSVLMEQYMRHWILRATRENNNDF